MLQNNLYKMLNQNNTHETQQKDNSNNKLRILIADDNSINSLLVKTVIENYNLNVELELVKNGNEALDAFVSFQPHLILMDIMMPDMNGYEATAEIKKINTNKNLKIYALTAGDSNDTFIKNEMSGYIEKPIDTVILKKIIEKCLTEIKN